MKGFIAKTKLSKVIFAWSSVLAMVMGMLSPAASVVALAEDEVSADYEESSNYEENSEYEESNVDAVNGENGVDVTDEENNINSVEDNFSLVISSESELTTVVGSSLDLIATVYNNGQEVSDLTATDIELWFWVDSLNTHSDGNSDAIIVYNGTDGKVTSANVTFPSVGTYYIVVQIEENKTFVDSKLYTITVTENAVETEDESKTEDELEIEDESVVLQDTFELVGTETEVTVGTTVSLAAKIIQNGAEITNLDESDYVVWWWADQWETGKEDGLVDAEFIDYDSSLGTYESVDITLPSVGTYYIIGELKTSDGTYIGRAYWTYTVIEESEELEDTFELVGNETEVTVGTTVSLTAKIIQEGEKITELDGSDYVVWWWADQWETGKEDGLVDAVFVDYDDTLGTYESVDITLPSVGTYYIIGELKTSDGTYIGRAYWTFTVIEKSDEDDDDNSDGDNSGTKTEVSPVEGELNLTVVDGLVDATDFAMGVDISSVISEFNSGVVYYDYDGNKITNIYQFCAFLKSQGITHVRVRVWNDPYDSDGNGYGGGNCNVDTARQIAAGCEAAGLKLLVDFHYSDFWADPGKYTAPKAWANMSLSEKVATLYNYTLSSLNTIDPNKTVVDMVQVGNETTGGIAGETGSSNMCTLFSAGSNAVRAYNADVKVVIHVTNPEKGNVTKWANTLNTYSVDYDVLATSYYPYWHGTLSNLASAFEYVQNAYDKDVMVAETSYAYTLEDSDGHSNTVSSTGNNTSANCTESFTVQGQATSIRNLINTVFTAGGIGVFYWEPAWISVGDITGLSGTELDAQIEANKKLWEANGSGWAASASGEYDSDAGTWYGGSAVDNEALFYSDGTPTASWHLWNYVKTGSYSVSISLDEIGSASEVINIGEDYTLPETVTVIYSSASIAESVSWNEADIAKIDINTAGNYVVNGTINLSKEISDGTYAGYNSVPTTYTLTVKAPNLITDANDAGIESADNFILSNASVKINNEDVYSGSKSLHWYSATATSEYAAYKKTILLAPGKYRLEALAMGYAGDVVSLEITDADGGTLATGNGVTLTGWSQTDWLTAAVDVTIESEMEISFNINLGISDGGWGSVDELYLYKTGDVVVDDEEESESDEEAESEDESKSGDDAESENESESEDEKESEDDKNTEDESKNETKTEDKTNTSNEGRNDSNTAVDNSGSTNDNTTDEKSVNTANTIVNTIVKNTENNDSDKADEITKESNPTQVENDDVSTEKNDATPEKTDVQSEEESINQVSEVVIDDESAPLTTLTSEEIISEESKNITIYVVVAIAGVLIAGSIGAWIVVGRKKA